MHGGVGPRHPLRQLFAGLIEQVFMSEVGICDPHVTSYLTELLTEFVHMDDIYRAEGVDGEKIREVSRMRADAAWGRELTESERRRAVNRYIGDFTLFWTGVFPEQLRPRRSGVDRTTEYLLEGKRSYHIAAELSPSHAEPPAELLAQLADQFECCVHGLHLVRVGWENLPQELHRN